MSLAEHHHHIHYIELSATSMEAAKAFYFAVFGWSFVDYGPDYASFTEESAGINGGIYRTEPHADFPKAAPLIVLYSSDLAATEKAITADGGAISVPTFEFPGGRRFHFSDGVGNHLAVWSE
jgi:uncharacterized protein